MSPNNDTISTTREFMSTQEVADFLCISDWKVKDMAKVGTIPPASYITYGRKRRFRRRDIVKLAEKWSAQVV